MPVLLLVLAALFGGMIWRLADDEATRPRCGDCRRQIPKGSGSCPYCGGRRG
jgi:rRNA maturation endonuclease Nob1